MPGIPWTSKGCNTCRRRKVGCDQTRPACQRCSKTGRVCEGYERAGKSNATRGSRKDGSDAFAPSSSASPASSSQGASVISLANLSPITFPPELDVSDITDYQLVHTFLDFYFPKETEFHPRASPDHQWLITAAELPDPGYALRLALRALAMSRIGWLTSNTDLVTHAQTNYIGALSEFQKALWDDVERREDRTLAAARTLTLYEIFESTSFKGWNQHAKGFAGLLQMRGPESLQSPFARSLTESHRSSAMFQCIQFREASFFTQPEWANHLHDPENHAQHVYDIGLEIAAFLGKFDQLVDSQAPVLGMAWQTLLARAVEFAHRLERFYARFVSRQSRLPLYWDQAASLHGASHGDLDHLGSLAPIEFHDIYTAHTVMNFWALKGIVAGTIGALCRKASYPQTSLALDGGNTSVAYEILKHQPNSAKCTKAADRIGRRLAIQIVRSAAYCQRDEMGMVGAQRCLFPMRIALIQLRMLNDDELEASEKLYTDLTTKKGLGYALQMLELPQTTAWHKIEGSRGRPRRNPEPQA